MDTVLDHERDSSPHHVEIELTILIPLEFGSLIRTVTFAGTFTALSIQIAFTAFLYEIVSFPLSSGKTRG